MGMNAFNLIIRHFILHDKKKTDALRIRGKKHTSFSLYKA